jgi:thioredoxin 2
VAVLTQTVCPACATPNGVAPGSDPRAAKCEKCGAALFQGIPLEVDDEILQRHITLTSNAVLVVVWAPWCGACRFIESDLVEAASRLEPGARLLKLNTNESESARAFGLGGIPALLLFNAGREIGRSVGGMTADQIVAWTHARLGTSEESSTRPPKAKSTAIQ